MRLMCEPLSRIPYVLFKRAADFAPTVASPSLLHNSI
jgi:hypothetical protein